MSSRPGRAVSARIRGQNYTTKARKQPSESQYSYTCINLGHLGQTPPPGNLRPGSENLSAARRRFTVSNHELVASFKKAT